jgi:RNA polymerase sigma-70 factor, ECF subfamily
VLTSTSADEATKQADSQSRFDGIAALTIGMASGNEDAFRRFHTLYFDRLLRYHIVIARGDEDAAHEALQETFMRVVRHARRFDKEEAFWSWLTVLCRSAAVDGGRKRQRYWNLIANYARSLVAPAPATSAVPDDADSLCDILNECLLDLSAEDRRLVEGKYFQRASTRELAEESGLTERAVESRLFRAREELRRKISGRLKS